MRNTALQRAKVAVLQRAKVAALQRAKVAVLQRAKVVQYGRGEKNPRAQILARRRESERSEDLRRPNPVVSELEISWTSREREELNCINREIEDDMMEPGVDGNYYLA